MEQRRTDPVMILIGLLLIAVIIGGITAIYAYPAEPSLKVPKYTSKGIAAGVSPCCLKTDLLTSESPGTLSSGCLKRSDSGCQKKALTGCQKTPDETTAYQIKKYQ